MIFIIHIVNGDLFSIPSPRMLMSLHAGGIEGRDSLKFSIVIFYLFLFRFSFADESTTSLITSVFTKLSMIKSFFWKKGY